MRNSNGQRSTNLSTPGSALLITAQILFMICGYLMHIVIARLLGPIDYGTWGILIALLIWFELVLMVGFPKWTTQIIAVETDLAEINRIKTISILGQGTAGLTLGIFFYLLAIPFAVALNDSNLEILLKISALDIPIYGLYFINVGIINGRGMYLRMFWLTVTYSISKAGLIALFIYLGFGLEGAAVGNILSSVIVFIVSCFLIGRISLEIGWHRLKDFYSFGIHSTIFILGFSLLHQIDFLILKRLSSEKEAIGFYLMAMMLAKVPYFIVEASSRSLFSEMNKRLGIKDLAGCTKILNNYVYSTSIIFALIVVVTIGSSRELILLIYPPVYGASAPFLKLLILSNSLVGFSYLLSHVFFSFKKEKIAAFPVFLMLMISFPLNYVMIKRLGPNGAAVSSLVLFSCGTLIIILMTRSSIRIAFPGKLFLKLTLAAAATIAFAQYYSPTGHWGYFIELSAGTTLFLGTLLLLREPYLISLLQKVLTQSSLKR